MGAVAGAVCGLRVVAAGGVGARGDPASVMVASGRFWAAALAGLPEQLDLPADRPRPAVASSVVIGAGGFDADVHAGVRGGGAGASMRRCSWWCMRRWRRLLSRLSGMADIAIGTPVAGRGERVLMI